MFVRLSKLISTDSDSLAVSVSGHPPLLGSGSSLVSCPAEPQLQPRQLTWDLCSPWRSRPGPRLQLPAQPLRSSATMESSQPEAATLRYFRLSMDPESQSLYQINHATIPTFSKSSAWYLEVQLGNIIVIKYQYVFNQIKHH